MFRETLGMRLRGAYLPFHRRADAEFAQFRLTADQFVLLTVLADEDGVTQRELAQRVYSDPNTVGEMLDRLEKRKLIRRERHPTDGRAWCIWLTPQGRKVQRLAFDRTEHLRRWFSAAFEPEELELFKSFLARFHATVTDAPGNSKSGVA